MRMWKVSPRILCDRHLLGEHVEMHMFTGCLLKGKSLEGYIRSGLVELHNIGRRHGELAGEMRRRGFSHDSPLPRIPRRKGGKVDVLLSMRDLINRCRLCQSRIKEENWKEE